MQIGVIIPLKGGIWMDLGDFYYFAVIILVGLIGIMIGVAHLRRKYDNLKKDYDSLRTSHDNLKSDVKLLNQENFYLKQMLNIDTDR